MGFFVLTALVLTAAEPPPVLVLLSRRTGVPAADATALVQRVADAGAEAGWRQPWAPQAAVDELVRKGLKDGTACNGRRACLAELGRQLGAAYVVAVSTGQVGTDRSVGVELFSVEDEQVRTKDAVVLPPGSEFGAAQLRTFVAAASAHLLPAPEAPTSPPVATSPAPPPATLLPPVEAAPSEAVLTQAPAPPRRHTASWVLLASSAAALVGGSVALGAALGEREQALRRLPGDSSRSPWTATQAQGHADAANALLGVTIGLAATALGLGLGAAVAW